MPAKPACFAHLPKMVADLMLTGILWGGKAAHSFAWWSIANNRQMRHPGRRLRIPPRAAWIYRACLPSSATRASQRSRCCGVLLRTGPGRLLPGVVRKARGASALALVKPQRAAWLQALGRKIAPPPSGGGAACGGCDSCGPTPPKQH